MVSDDLTALSAISMGALASAAVTFALIATDPKPRDEADGNRSVVVAPVERSTTCAAPGTIVDFAIIRSGGEPSETHLTVGSVEPSPARGPEPSLQLRLLRAR